MFGNEKQTISEKGKNGMSMRMRENIEQLVSRSSYVYIHMFIYNIYRLVISR